MREISKKLAICIWREKILLRTAKIEIEIENRIFVNYFNELGFMIFYEKNLHF